MFLKHNLDTNHCFNFKIFKMLVNIHNKQLRRIAESSSISNYDTIKHRPDFLKLIFLFS